MSWPPRTVIEYRGIMNCSPIFRSRCSAVRTGASRTCRPACQHFHNCLEIGLCESDGGFGVPRGAKAFRAGDVTIISGDVPHDLVGPWHRDARITASRAAQQAVQGHYYILSPQEYPAVQSLVRSMLAEMQAAARWTMRSACGAVRGAGR